jgi:hypothetical protein
MGCWQLKAACWSGKMRQLRLEAKGSLCRHLKCVIDMKIITEWQRQLLNTLGTIMQKHGFEAKPRDQLFRLKQAHGWSVVHLSFAPNTETAFYVTTDVAIRFDQVEQIVNQGNDFLSQAEKNQTATIGCELGNLEKGEPRHWEISCDAEVQSVAVEIEHAIRTIAMPYINHNTKLENVYDFLALNNPSGWVHCPLPNERCKRVLAIAMILRRGENSKALIQACEEFLKSSGQFALQDFREFADRVWSQ